MKKKIDLFWYWFIFVVAFVLCFFAINDKKVNAYHLNENGNLVSDNLIKCPASYNLTNDWQAKLGCYSIIDNNTEYSYSISLNKSGGNGNGGVAVYLFKDIPVDSLGNWFPDIPVNATRILINEDSDVNINSTFNSNEYSYFAIYFGRTNDTSRSNITNIKIMLNNGNTLLSYEPFGTWYSESFVGDLATGVISFNSASLTYDNIDYGTSHSIADVSSYIDSSFGYLYFERLWQYLDTLTSSEYENAWLTLQLSNKMNLNTTYILNAMFNNGNYGVGAKFYQGNNLILDVTNWSNSNYAYCNETSGATCSVQLSNFVNVGDRPDLQNSFTYFDKIEIWSGDTDKRVGSFGFQNISYNQGYNSGYNIGYSTGSSNGETIGYNKGYNNGYLYGYEKGVDAVEGTDNTLVGLVGNILTAPVNMLKTIFDFEFLGINLTHFIFSIVSLFIVIWLIKIFL